MPELVERHEFAALKLRRPSTTASQSPVLSPIGGSMSGRRRPATVRIIGADVRWGT